MYDGNLDYERELIRIAQEEVIDEIVSIIESSGGFDFNKDRLIKKILDLKKEQSVC